MNTIATGLSRPSFLSPPSWWTIAAIAAAAAGVALLLALPADWAAVESTISAAAQATAPQAEPLAAAGPAVGAGTGVPDAAAVFRSHEPADEPTVATF